MALFEGDIFSPTLKYNTHIKVIFPDVSSESMPMISGKPSVLYLLHGLSDNASAWTRFTRLEYYAKKYNFIVIMPDAARSFYTDMRMGMPYFTYFADELPETIGAWFRIPTEREKTFIAGLSMGGYGAVKIGLNRPERFGGVATFSGVLNTEVLFQSDKLLPPEDRLMFDGEVQAIYGQRDNLRDEDTPIELVKKLSSEPNRPRLLQCCGTEDFLYTDNIAFKTAAETAGYGHKYMEWSGAHTWLFWDVAIQRAMQYFCGLDCDTSAIC